MTRRADHAYAATRMAARLGDMPNEELWQRLDLARRLGPWLEDARATPLRHWLTRLAAATPFHDLEGTLRAEWREAVAETANWLPAPERPAILWLATLPDLPGLQAERSGTIAMRAASAAAPTRETEALARLPAGDLARLWQAEWRRRLAPAALGAVTIAGPFLEALLLPDLAIAAETTAQLRRRFRRHAGEPAASFFYLALLWIEFVRTRGAVMRRATLQTGRAAA